MILITDPEFSLFQKLINEQAGIHLTPAKKSLLEARLGKRVFELGLDSFSSYYRYLQDHSEEELPEMLDRVSTNETHFFRDRRQFDFLSRLVVYDWTAQGNAGLRPRHIRVWSAGCSTGEEAYSLAMVLWQFFPPAAGWEIEILATDLSNRALHRARQAIWPIDKAKDVPEEYLKRFMLRGRGPQAGKMKAGAEIRSVIRFERLNLNDKIYPITSLFDIILCRNVLIYFDETRRARIADRLLEHLAPGGFFFVGHAERLSGLTHKILNIFPSIYVRVGRGDSNFEGAVFRREASGVR
ncbi:MAG: protein-glutamate O-methyltransferase CheR [Deltaproteobacteria bacterium]|nr:protein-glutamate O-methyltransferase CheR [Deltaproteobacteria bacterium]